MMLFPAAIRAINAAYNRGFSDARAKSFMTCEALPDYLCDAYERGYMAGLGQRPPADEIDDDDLPF